MRLTAILIGSASLPIIIFLALLAGEPKLLLGIYPSAQPLLLVLGQLTVGALIGKYQYLLLFALMSVLLFVFVSSQNESTANRRVFYILFFLISVLNVIYILVSSEYAIRHQGVAYLVAVVVWNIIFGSFALACLIIAGNTENVIAGIGYRWALLAWPLSVAFPWMGETF